MKTKAKQRNWSPGDLAKASGVSLDTIRYWIRIGKLKTRKLGGRRLIAHADAAPLLKRKNAKP